VKDVAERVLVLDGLRTALLEAGAGAAVGPPVLLLHGGAWGESAETTWGRALELLGRERHVLAPDWLGFGGSAKVRDLADTAGFMLRHVARLLETLDVSEVDAVGHSMGGAHLLRDLTAARPILPVRRAVLAAAGGPPISGDARARLDAYDGSLESMREQVRLAFADPRWADDEQLVRRRHELSLLPGAYEWFASLRLRPPGARSSAGDPTPYERVRVPTLVTAGTADPLKPAGYAEEVARRIPGARLCLLDGAGHCPQLEAVEDWTTAVLDFLADKEIRP